MYKVISAFADRLDNMRTYHAGDTYPRDGMTVSKARLAELAGSGNRTGHPLIELVEPEEPLKRTRRAKK